MSNDTIYRQDAIDALDGEIEITGRTNAEAVKGYVRLVRDRLERLPSAQSEIVRCKDCKYGDTFHKFDEPDMPMKCLGQHYGGTYPDDFCSYAERREE